MTPHIFNKGGLILMLILSDKKDKPTTLGEVADDITSYAFLCEENELRDDSNMAKMVDSLGGFENFIVTPISDTLYCIKYNIRLLN
jgi:hypothetical protein